MLVLGIETSTRRGSVALIQGDATLAVLAHEELNAHAERILGLIEQALAQAGLTRTALDRIAVGIGPGSFTGLRVGVALAQGIALGLDRPLVGVGSLRAMASGVPADDPRTRVAVLDARRGELFIGAYAPDGREVFEPTAIPLAEARGRVLSELAGHDCVLVGESSVLLGDGFALLRAPELDLPHALAVARLGRTLDPGLHLADPAYVRGPGATLPNLPPSPLG